MGYTTKFTGCVHLTPPLTITQAHTLLAIAAQDAEPPLAGGVKAPSGYMQWVPGEDLACIVWDQNEKFYDYTEWLVWLCRWLEDNGIAANGELKWSGESATDHGKIVVIGNAVAAEHDKSSAGRPAPQPLTITKLGELALLNAAKSNA